MKKRIGKIISSCVLSLMLCSNIILTAHAYNETDEINQPNESKQSFQQSEPNEFNSYSRYFFFNNQEVTADSKPTGAKGANGKVMKVGYCAVHPYKQGDRSTPIFTFGSMLLVTAFDGRENLGIPHPSGELDSLSVQDLGDVNYRLHPNSKYWVDTYWGPQDTMEKSAKDFGNAHTIDYKTLSAPLS